MTTARTWIRPEKGDQSWRTDAACRTMATRVFFPPREDARASGWSSGPAKVICEGCPVRAECLEYALANKVEHGIWGGRSAKERRSLRRKWLQQRRRGVA